MKIKSTLAAAVATVILAGAGASAAQATSYDITGGNYTSAPKVASFLAGPASSWAVQCNSASFSGNTDNVAGAPQSSEFTPALSDCREWPVYNPMVATVPHPWKMTVLSESTPGVYNVRIDVVGGVLAEFAFPLPQVYPCRSTFSVPAGGLYTTVRRVAAGLEWTGQSAIQANVQNCQQNFSAAAGKLSLSSVTFPGVDIDEL